MRAFIQIGIKIIIGILFLPFLLLIGILASMQIHQMRLASFENKFNNLTHPANTNLARSIYWTGGNISGTGNQCDIFCCELRKYNGDKTELKKHSKDKTIHIDGRKEKFEIVFLGDESLYSTDFYQLNDINNWVNNMELKNKNLYAVFLIDGGYNPLLDYRCY